MKRLRTSAVVLAAVATGVAASAVAGGAPGRGPRGGGIVRAIGPNDVPSLDPAFAVPTGLAAGVEYATCGTLMAFRDSPGRTGESVRPEAAAGTPKISRDRRSYLFKVRRGLRFSDGTALTAANFAHELQRVRSHAMRSPAASLFADVERVKPRGLRLRIELRRPSGDLLTRLALPYACPVPRHFPLDPAGVDLKVGSGPYYVARRVPGSLIALRRNRYYRGSRPHRVAGVDFNVRGDIGTDIKAVARGSADVLAAELPGELRPALARRYGVNRRQLFRSGGPATTALVLNTSRGLFRHNIRLRKAVNFAVDRAAVLDGVGGGGLSHPLTDQITPRWIPGWRDYRLYPLRGAHRRTARRLAHGHLRGRTAVLWTTTGPGFLEGARVVASNLRSIGLRVNVKVMAVAVLNAKAGAPGAGYDMILAAFPLNYPDPADALVRLLGRANARRRAGNSNFAYFDSRKYDRRMAAANRLSGSGRYRVFSRLDAEIMRNQAPWVPLYENSVWLFISKRLGCFAMHPMFRLDVGTVCLR